MAKSVDTQVRAVEIPAQIGVRDLADRMQISPVDLLKALIANGIMASISQMIDFDTAAIVAHDLGFELRPEGYVEPVKEEEAAPEPEPAEPGVAWYLVDEDEDALAPRPPVVTVMGHVDHGKTSLLDKIRQTSVTATEAGGITQHIGAHVVSEDGRLITLIDTPGHEAFTAMRARGAQVTDVAVLVVAADDGVMPQTREAIDHARAAGVPIVVALNKMDLEAARPDFVKQQLAELDLTPDDWGGHTFVVPVSATRGDGIDDLLQAVLLVAEESAPRANPTGAARGTVLEGRIEARRGVTATLLVQTGTLRRGDFVVTEGIYGRIRAMTDSRGENVTEAGPSTPVAILGLPGVPAAGSRFEVAATERQARQAAERFADRVKVGAVGPRRPVTLEELLVSGQAGGPKTLSIVLKTDVHGSLEPIQSSLEQLSTDEVKVRVLRADTGDVSESDVSLAAASGAVVIGFQAGADPAARAAAERLGVDVRRYEVIYDLLPDIEAALMGMLEPEVRERRLGRAEVRAVFDVPRVGRVAGCYVKEGRARRNATVRVWRNGTQMAQTTASSVRRFTEDVREVREGFECGIGLEGFDAFEVGDVLEFVVLEKVE